MSSDKTLKYEELTYELDGILTNIEEFWESYGMNPSKERTVQNALDEIFGAIEKKYNVEIKANIDLEFKEMGE